MTVTDRAQRYRAQGNVLGPRRCELCGSQRFLVVDHRDGDEWNDRPSNLRWLCKSCNTRLGAKMARHGKGRRTRQYNAGARSLGAYVTAAKAHQRGARDAGGRIIHETPPHKRSEFAREIWALRRRFNPDDYRHEHLSEVPRGWRVRTIDQAGHLVRVAFPPGPRRKGTGKLISILHPVSENPYTCNPEGLHLSLCVDPQQSIPGAAHPSLCVDPQPARNPVADQIHALESKSAARPLTKKEAARLRALQIQAARGNGKRRNAANGAAQMYKDFHGRSATEVLTMQDALIQSGEYTALGDDPELWLRPVTGDPAKWGEGDISFDPSDNVKLATNATGGQLFLVGDNQALDLSDLKGEGIDTSKRFIDLGEVYAVSYMTEKSFDRFQSVPYAHVLGEETGQRPRLVYDKETRRMLLVGGAYSIAPVDRALGASPGIVN